MSVKIKSFLLFIILLIAFSYGDGYTLEHNASEQAAGVQPDETKLAGEFYGVPVPLGNYYFAKRVVMTYSATWRGTAQNDKELEDLVWQELLFSYEAFRRGIEVSDDEIDTEVEKILKENKADFSWRVDKEKFQKWTQEKLGVMPELFRNQVEHLLKLQKLRQQVIDSLEPEVSDEEAYQKFLDEYNTLLVELVQFDEKADADKFYQEVNVPVSEKDLDMLIWNDALLSHEAFKLGIKAEEETVDKAVDAVLQDNEAYFRWKDDPEKFSQFLKEKMGLAPEVFRDRMRKLVIADALIKKIAAKEADDVGANAEYQQILKSNMTVALAYWNFLNAYVPSDEDIIRFDSIYDARDFYNKIRRGADAWQGKKRQDPAPFKRPGFVALDFLLHMWGFERDAAYKMLDVPVDSIYPPAPIYKGYGVFKILKIRKADPAEFEKRKDQYFERVKMLKKLEGFAKWAEDFKKNANIKVYVK